MKLLFIPLLIITSVCFGQSSIQTYCDTRLLTMLKVQQADNGLVILKDVSTGKIIATSAFVSKKTKSGTVYVKDSSILNTNFEPGSLMIPISTAYLIDNTNLDITDSVNIENGTTTIRGLKIFDSEKHEIKNVSIKTVNEISSNVGISKLYDINVNYSQASNFIDAVNNYIFDSVYFGSIDKSEINLPLVTYGYGLMFTPNQILNFYNRVANNDQNMFSKPSTLVKMQEVLEGVSQNGTSKVLLKNSVTPIASKTGTTLAVSKNGYTAKQYYSSMSGYAPISSPKYSCIVLIKCKTNSPQFYGAVVAGPVFRDILNEACK
jgi:cell division protein FtsI (penicillin-binding protein 3)